MGIPSKGRRESAVLKGIVTYLSFRGDIVAWRLNTGGFAPRPGAFVKFGTTGAGDLICCQAPQGRFIGIETKREKGGRLSDAQRAWGQSVTAHGGLYVVARSVDEVRKALGEPSVRIRRSP